MKWGRKHSVVAAVALIAATNTVALVGVVYNRTGEPESTLRLSQRELGIDRYRTDRENSGLALQLNWRVLDEGVTNPEDYRYLGPRYGTSAKWLDKEKMAALGFDVTVPDKEGDNMRTFQHELARDVFLALEMDGPTYQRALAKATATAAQVRAAGKKDADKLSDEILEREGKTSSRLFVVDASLDAASLRAKYPDRTRYAIVSGRVEPMRGGFSPAARSHGGYVSAVNVDEINVPLELRAAFSSASNPNEYDVRAAGTAYDATVAFGRRFEPWLVSATRSSR